MKGLKKIIAGTGLLLSGSIGVAIGNLEQTTFYTSSTSINESGKFVPIPTYYLFISFIIAGIVLILLGIKDN